MSFTVNFNREEMKVIRLCLNLASHEFKDTRYDNSDKAGNVLQEIMDKIERVESANHEAIYNGVF